MNGMINQHRNPKALKEMWIVKSPVASHVGKILNKLAIEANVEPVVHFMNLLAEHDTRIRWKCETSIIESVRMELLSNKHCCLVSMILVHII
ncbi:MAG: hypothetical protein IPF58_05765 [Saprospirales bacterium]|nr:hypothetical protein [Saprospirales bacterium]